MEVGPVILFLSIIITTFNRGFFSFPALGILVTLYGLLLILFFRNNKKINSSTNCHKIFSFVLVVSYTVFLFFSGGIYQTELIPSYFLLFLPIFFLPLVLTYLLPDIFFGKKQLKLRFFVLLIAAFVLRILIIIASPEPIIDVYTIQKEAPQLLLSGTNPYDAVYTQVYPGVKNDYYSYWPVSFLAQIPFIILFKDPRVLPAIADVAAALLLYLLGKGSIAAQALSLIYLYRPNSNFIIEQSWLDPSAIFLVLLIYYLWQKHKNKLYILGGLMGLLAGLKLYYALMLPFFILLTYKKGSLRTVIKLCLGLIFTLTITVYPFLLWNRGKFIQNTFLDFLTVETRPSVIPLHQSLNLNTLYYILTGKDIPLFIVLPIFVGIVSLLFYKLANSKKTDKDDSYLNKIIVAQALVFLSLFIIFQYAFINYYYFVTGLLILWSVIKVRGLR